MSKPSSRGHRHAKAYRLAAASIITFICFECLAQSGKGVHLGNPKDPIVASQSVPEPNGGFHFVYIHGKYVTPERPKLARECFDALKDDLKRRAANELKKNVSDDCITKAKNAMGAAAVIDDEVFDKQVKADPELSKRERLHAYTEKGGQIFLRKSSWENPKVSTAKNTELLVHEGMHVALYCANAVSLREMPDNRPEPSEKLIVDLLKHGCSR